MDTLLSKQLKRDISISLFFSLSIKETLQKVYYIIKGIQKLENLINTN